MSDNLPDDLHEFESALRSITPHPPRIDPARLMYLAGQESVRATQGQAGRTSRWWPAATAFSSALALTLAIVIVVRPQAEPVIVYRELPAPAVKEAAKPDLPPAPPTTIPEKPQAEPPASPWPRLFATWLPTGGLRQRQFAVLQNTESMTLASTSDGGSQPVAHRELLDQYLRESGYERATPPAAAFPWPFTQTGVQ